MEYTLGLCSLVILIAHQTAECYNIAKYTEPLPTEIRPIVQRALYLESEKNKSLCDVKQKVACPAVKYREPAGKCNNVRFPDWGTRGQKFLRILKPDYVDGKSVPRDSPTVRKLPSPQTVATSFQKFPTSNHESISALLGAWTELLLHDLVSTGNMKSDNCCNANSHPECYQMLTEGKCKEYKRTLPAVDMDTCYFAHRDQMNLATSFLDASAVYGNNEEEMNKIRANNSPMLNISMCGACSSNPLYAIFLKEHNRVVGELKKINKVWTDNELFYEAKRVVSAELQHITYNEYLPLILGEEIMIQSDLKPLNHGRFTKYSSKYRAGIYNEVGIGVLPSLLSLMPPRVLNKSSNFQTQLNLLLSTPALGPNIEINLEVRPSWDSFALFLHMGRDHGIPSYMKYRDYCANEEFQIYINFEDLEQYGIEKKYYKLLKKLYGVATDVDLLLGGLLEKPISGALLGRTFICLLKQQFELLKKSDRFWYENDIPPSSFTTNQLVEVKKVTLAGLICSNSDLLKIQPKVFVQVDPYLNAEISCDQFPQINFTEWEEHSIDLSEDQFKDAWIKAKRELVDRRRFEYEVWLKNKGVNPKSPQGTAVAFSKANKNALKLANNSLLYELASNELVTNLMHYRKKRHLFVEEDFPLARYEISNSLQNLDVSNYFSHLELENQFEHHLHCDEIGPCDPHTPFRTYTGHCNNLRNPSWGKSLTTFKRLLPNAYEDGISKPRKTSITGQPLPNPRIISRIVHPDISSLHSKYTLMTMQFAQLLDHDITLTPVHKGFEESIPDCRSCDSMFTVHPECDPLPIPPGDDYYPEYNITTGERMCLHSMRSLPGQQHFGPREQINMNSAFLDGSMIYGENPCKAKDLRGNNGLMNYTTHPVRGKDLLPQTHKHPECRSPSGLCFDAGDPRASEQPALTAIHTIFMREHNRLSDIIRNTNSHWDEEKIFQHVRRIVIAEFQHITYNEFLPRLLGWDLMNFYELKLQPNGYYKGYDPTCNPSIVNVFAAAAFRIGHSLLRPHIPRMDPNYQILHPPILLRDGFFKVDMMMRENMVDEITRGLISTPIETLDQFITGEVTNHLFEDRRIPFSGIDLISRNLQRARDHGLPSYNHYREFCHLGRANSFEDLSREMSQESILRLKSVYAHVDDIDIFPGGMSERSVKGGMIGPTFGCIIALQFKYLRKCDRFWYENIDPVVRFTEQQLAEIRKTTLSKILCLNMDIDGYIQRSSFDLPSNFLNPRVPCHSLPTINLNAWKEFGNNQGCIIGDKFVKYGEGNFPTPCTSCICTPQGGNCASLKINDCNELLRSWPREAILKDEVCTAQCEYYLGDKYLEGHIFKDGLTKFSHAHSNYDYTDLSDYLKK